MGFICMRQIFIKSISQKTRKLNPPQIYMFTVCQKCKYQQIYHIYIMGVAVVKWLSSWLGEQGVRVRIPVFPLEFQRLGISCS